MQQIQDIEVTKTTIVACSGGEMGHPKVYLHIKDGKNKVECPYCGKVYVLESESLHGKISES